MKKILKLTVWGFVVLFLVILVYGLLIYQFDPSIKALVNNNESKLFYRPINEFQVMDNLDYSENILRVEGTIKIHTYFFKPKIKAKANIFLIRGNSGNTSTSREIIEPLVNNGFRVYSVDWRGFGKSNGTPML